MGSETGNPTTPPTNPKPKKIKPQTVEELRQELGVVSVRPETLLTLARLGLPLMAESDQ